MKKSTSNRLIKRGMTDRVFNIIVTIIMTLLVISVLYPTIYVISSSFSSGSAVTNGDVYLWPVDFTLTGYQTVFANRQIWSGYMNSIMYAGLGTIWHLFMTICLAYPLSRKNFYFKNFFYTMLKISIILSGGMIPTYIIMSKYGLVNTRLLMIISGGVTIGHIIIMRTFFQSNIPEELYESAKMDGITDYGYLLRIVLPLSKASISVISLYSIVGKWNSYVGPMIYLRDKNKYPLQLIARTILNGSKVDMTQYIDVEMANAAASNMDSMKYALIIVSVIPMMILYPVVQKFFAKGVMIGSLKG